ncbi:alpha/beta fold hydrolase [Variovorax terrae]|uniref:Alpha/beta hydrolase n=1 Tax=Variovorax terrae TaxID=2923278 RepID=A0A9X2ALF8_9BURK|nr:alpha/beta hydrolase [Variovorax terrae]MCJ0761615.1 alpha/beta hydrolase [Variovorax terrae]
MPLARVPWLRPGFALALAAAAAMLVFPATATVAQTPEPVHGRDLLHDGDVAIEVLVNGIGPSVVLLPSSQRDSLDFDDIAQRIAQAGYRVLRPQPRGMGRSSGPLEGLDLSVLARDVAFTIDKLGEGRAVIVGHAYGHFVARVTDMSYPSRVRGVVVLGAAAKTFPKGMVESLAIAADPGKPRDERLTQLQFSMFAPGNDASSWLEGWHPELREVYRKAGAAPNKDVWWPVSNSPILDIQGEEDPWRPAATRNELKDVLGDKVTVRVIPRAGHALIPEQPAAVAEAIIAWIRTLEP